MFDIGEIARMPIPWILGASAWLLTLVRSRNLWESMKAAAKSMTGYYLIAVGALLLPFTTVPVNTILQRTVGLGGGIMNSESYGAYLLVRYCQTGTLILLLAFLVNLLCAKISRLKGVYLTIHHLLYLSMLTAAIVSGENGRCSAAGILLGGTALGVYSWISVSLCRDITQKLTGQENVSLANSNMGAALLSSVAGKLAGRPGDDRNPDSKIGKRASFQDIPLMGFLGMLLTYALLWLMAGGEAVREITGETHPAAAAIAGAFLYSAQLMVLMQGIRFLMRPFIEALWDLAEKSVKGYWRGLDVSALITVMPEAWRLGFMISCITAALADAVMIFMRVPYIALMTPTCFFFTGGLSGVVGCRYGGKRGLYTAAALSGIVTVLMVSLMMSVGRLPGDIGVSFGEIQYSVYGMLMMLLSRVLP